MIPRKALFTPTGISGGPDPVILESTRKTFIDQKMQLEDSWKTKAATRKLQAEPWVGITVFTVVKPPSAPALKNEGSHTAPKQVERIIKVVEKTMLELCADPDS